MPAQFPLVPLGDLIIQDRDFVGSIDGDEYPVLGVTNIEGVTVTGIEASDDKSKYLRLRPNRFVYNPYRINVGSIGLSRDDQDGIASPAYVIFKTKDQLDSQFLFRFLKSNRGNQLINFYGNRGTVRSALRFEDLCKIEIPLPPLDEQRRIVARIEQLAAKIEEAKGLRKQAVEEAEAVIPSERKEVFETAKRKFKNKQLGNLIKMVSGEGLLSSSFDDSLHYPVYGGGGYVGKYSSYLVEESTVVIGRVGARCGCVFITEPKAWITDNALYISKMNEELDKAYLVHALIQLDLRQRANQAAQPVVSQKKINPEVIPVPPLDEQRRIVAYLDGLQSKVDALKQLQAETHKELDALLPSILDKAFRGEL